MEIGEDALRVNRLCKRFGSIIAVDDLSFSVMKGEIFALLGPNGAGKTTTISMIVGLLSPDSGSIEGGQSGGRAIGLCPQEIIIWETLTCFEQLLFMGRMHDLREAGPAPVPRNCSMPSDSRIKGIGWPRPFRAECGGGSISPSPWCTSPLSSYSTSRRPDSTPRAASSSASTFVRSRDLRPSSSLPRHGGGRQTRRSSRHHGQGRLLILDSPENLKTALGGVEIVEVRKRTLEDVFIGLTGRGLRE